jgi:RNA polymerase sigma factor (sigma-70 family)
MVSRPPPDPDWPPADAAAYVAGLELLDLISDLASRNVAAPFRADAVALVIDWLESQVIAAPGWFDRFRSDLAWRRYLRKAIVNAGRRASRTRAKERPLDALPVDWRGDDPLEQLTEQEDRELLLAAVDRLSVADQTLVRMILQGIGVSEMASRLGVRKQSASARVGRLLDRLARDLGK